VANFLPFSKYFLGKQIAKNQEKNFKKTTLFLHNVQARSQDTKGF
jgi:hypothetical protein